MLALSYLSTRSICLFSCLFIYKENTRELKNFSCRGPRLKKYLFSGPGVDGAPSLFTKIVRSPQEQHFAGVFLAPLVVFFFFLISALRRCVELYLL